MATSKKTVKKVETPIDERETFISLQKSFADSAVAVGEKLNILYKLQGADNDLEKLMHLRGELPSEVAALEEDMSVLQAKVARLEEAIAQEQESIEANGAKIVEHDDQIARYKDQLANIANSREYDSIDKELENENLLRQIAQKFIYEAKDRIEEHRKSITEIQGKIAVVDADLTAKKEELDVIVNSTADEEKALRERRDAFAAQLDARTMSAYEHIRASVNNHLAVVPVYRENACGGCFNIITPQRLVDIASGSKLIICEHCGRIIVNPVSE